MSEMRREPGFEGERAKEHLPLVLSLQLRREPSIPAGLVRDRGSSSLGEEGAGGDCHGLLLCNHGYVTIKANAEATP